MSVFLLLPKGTEASKHTHAIVRAENAENARKLVSMSSGEHFWMGEECSCIDLSNGEKEALIILGDK
jgi:hypothetical protein